VLVDRAYPNLEENARECIALNHYLSQLSNPQVSLAVKQRHPKNITEAVAATLELESYVLMMPGTRDNGTHAPASSAEQDVQSVQFNVMEMLLKLAEKLEQLEQKLSKEGHNTAENKGSGGNEGPVESFATHVNNQDIMLTDVPLPHL